MKNKEPLARDFNKILDMAFAQDDSVVLPDLYSGYTYPLSNIILTESKNLVFQFALPGCSQEHVGVAFEGDYLVLDVETPDLSDFGESGRYLKRSLLIRDVHSQKFFVPQERFNHEAVYARLKKGILTIKVPALILKDKGLRLEVPIETD